MTANKVYPNHFNFFGYNDPYIRTDLQFRLFKINNNMPQSCSSLNAHASLNRPMLTQHIPQIAVNY